MMAKAIQSSNQQTIPVVHESCKVTGNGMLTERQKKWVSAPPNDFSVENPVLYRHSQQEQKKKDQRSESLHSVSSVRGLLSENLDSQKSSGGIIEKIQEGRKARHNAAYEDMMQELEAISLELEPKVQGLCSTYKANVHNDDLEIEEKMNDLLTDNKLVTFSTKQLDIFWKDLEKHSAQRVDWVDTLDKSLENIEDKRGKMIGKVLKTYTEVLQRIAHLMPSDVMRLLEEEMLKVNKSMLNNHKAYADLNKRLLTADVEKEKKLYNQWITRCEGWKSLKLAEAIAKHKEFMNDEAICNSPYIQEELNKLITQQAFLNNKRLELLNQLRDMKPPSSSKTAVYKWNQAITKVTDELDQLHLQYMSFVRLEQEKIISQCNNYVIKLRNDLFNNGIVAENVLEELMQDAFLPLLGERKAIFQYEQEKLEKHFSDVAAEQKQHLKILFKFAQGAGHVWDNHELGLCKEERTLQELLDKNRREHDYENQMKEAKLDIVMDRMRQESTEEALVSSLKLALQMMEEIKKGYYEFHGQQKSICEKYPHMVTEEIKRYSASLCKYFNVLKRSSSNQSLVEDATEVVLMILSTGTTYEVNESYECLPPGTQQTVMTSHTFITTLDDDDMPVEERVYIKNFLLSSQLILELKNKMRLEFLEHLEKWNIDALRRSESVVVAKIEEINNELDLRLHLHKPRSGRAEKDVHDVRVAELLLHRERVEQHCAGISDALADLKVSYQNMLDDHTTQNEIFRQSVEKLEESFNMAINTQELKSLQDDVNNNLSKYMESIRASVRQYRTYLDDMLNRLRNSNATFRKAFQIFSEGGNFSPDEVEEHRKKLEKSSAKIDNCEGSLIGELEGLETKRMDVAKEFAGKLEEKFKQHLFDLTFIEKINRWLSNIQVKIKSEVANSNSQSQQMGKMIAVFSRRIEQLQNVAIDNQKYTSEQLHETLLPLLKCFQDRVNYLNCALKKEKLSFFSLQENILKKDVSKKLDSAKKKFKKSTKKMSAKDKMNRSPSRQSPNLLSPTKSPPAQVSKENSTNEEVNATESSYKPLSGYGNRHSSAYRLTQYGGKYDRRYLVFGEYNPDEDELRLNFSDLQLGVLQNGLDGLLSTAELYYRQKGQRSTTRSQLISETFEGCAETLIQRLRKYKQQTEVYHNSCIQELRAQIKLFLECCQKLPFLLITSLSTNHQILLEEKKEKDENIFNTSKERNERRKKEYQTLLRPTLGHPNNKTELNKLMSSEKKRQKEINELQKTFHAALSEHEKGHVINVVNKLQSISAQMLTELDQLVTLDDVIEGQSTSKPKSEKELIAAKLYGVKKEEKTPMEDLQKESFTWPPVDLQNITWSTDFNLEQELNAIIQSLQSKKKTPCHQALIQARDNEIKEVVTSSLLNNQSLVDFCNSLNTEEERWKVNWNNSLKKILDLY